MTNLTPTPLKVFAIALCSLFFALAVVVGEENGYRDFTNTEGKEIRARLVDKKAGIAHLRMADGIVYRVPISKLSQSDREYVDNWDPAEVREEKLREVDLGELFAARGFKGVPLTVEASQSLLKITIAGETLRFLLDTGAMMTVLDRAKAEELKLAIRENVGFAAGIGGNAGAVGITRLDSVEVGDVKKTGVQFAVMDLRSVQSKHGTSGFDGIVGFDLLHALKAVIDYDAAVLYLREDEPGR